MPRTKAEGDPEGCTNRPSLEDESLTPSFGPGSFRLGQILAFLAANAPVHVPLVLRTVMKVDKTLFGPSISS
jgi:hypothetical protein